MKRKNQYSGMITFPAHTLPTVFKAALPEPPPFHRDFLMHAVAVIEATTAKARLAAAREDALAAMARVHPTPTYDAVAADLGFDPHMVL